MSLEEPLVVVLLLLDMHFEVGGGPGRLRGHQEAISAQSFAVRMSEIPLCMTRWSWMRNDGRMSARSGWVQNRSLAEVSLPSAKRILVQRTSL